MLQVLCALGVFAVNWFSTAFFSKHSGVVVLKWGFSMNFTALFVGTLDGCARRSVSPAGEGTVSDLVLAWVVGPFALRSA